MNLIVTVAIVFGICTGWILAQDSAALTNGISNAAFRRIVPMTTTIHTPTNTTGPPALAVDPPNPTPSAVVSNASSQTVSHEKEHILKAGLQNFIEHMRLAVDTFEDDVSKDNLGAWVRNLMTDFESTDHAYKGNDGKVKARYRVMLTSPTSEKKFENLLFMNHDNAVKYCKANFENGTLLTLNTAHEAAEIINWVYYKMRLPAKIWLGASKITRTYTNSESYSSSSSSPHFVWDDDSGLVNYTNWHKATGKSTSGSSYGYTCEPSNSGYDESCIEMYSHYYPYPVQCDGPAVAGQWNDVSCNNKKINAIVCKKIVKAEESITEG